MFADTPLESHEKLIPSFRGAGADADGSFALDAGGGPQGIEGRFAERPWPLKGSFGGVVSILSCDVVVVDVDFMELVSVPSPSCTSSSEDADIRCAVSNGDLDDTCASKSSCFSSDSLELDSGTKVSSSVEASVDPRGVEVAEDGPPSVRERGIEDVDLCDCWDCGRDAVSGASSKVSWKTLAIDCSGTSYQNYPFSIGVFINIGKLDVNVGHDKNM